MKMKVEQILGSFTRIKNQKLKTNIILIKKDKDANDYLDFEQNQFSGTATGIYKIGHVSVRLMKWLASLDGFFIEKIKCYDLMASVLSFPIEKSEQ